ncbi:MAG: hypothetical protein IJI78_00395 [Oscillospiraceae bacterium]|nr:hypothetical protein [Oscillospiraceae bacterium]
MSDRFERFDMAKPPRKCFWFFRILLWALCFPGVWAHKTKLKKIGMEGVKPPYLLLGNHNAFFDMKVSIVATFPFVANYVVAIDGYIGREWLLRAIGCICKRKFTNDPLVVRHMMRVAKNGGIVGLYPEARYSLCGTTAPLPESLGQFCKLLKIPVVMLLCHGHHINHPFWNTRRERKVAPTEATMKLLFTPDQLKEMTADEINRALVHEFQYDDFRWQLENHISVKDPDRALGLEKILYQCPHCGKEYRMIGSGTQLKCENCGKTWEMDEYGQLHAENGETEFSHIPDWYEWERDNVRKEVEAGTYNSGILNVQVESLPNAKKFIPLGSGTMVHDMGGFHVKVTSDDGTVYTMEKTVPSLYSCHIEYLYLFKHGDCVDLNTLEDTWYTYPEGRDFSVTKMALATEELYYDYRRKQGNPCEEGLA